MGWCRKDDEGTTARIVDEWAEGDKDPGSTGFPVCPLIRLLSEGWSERRRTFRVEQDYEEMKGRWGWITLKAARGKDGIIMSPWLPWPMPSDAGEDGQ